MHPETEDYQFVSARGLPPEPARRLYWQIVKESLREIYQKDPGIVDVAEEKLRNDNPGTQQKIYQTEPLTIAKELAGQGDEPVTAEEIFEYLKIKARHLPGEIPDLDAIKERLARP
jgi:hypothetical protein